MPAIQTPQTQQTTGEIPEVVKKAISLIGDIATLPEVTVKIVSLVENPRSTARDLHNVIKTDPALSARLLKVVNSAFYGLPGQVSTVDRAIVLLGLSTVKNIAIAASISRLFTAERISDSFTARDIWRHSVAVGVLTRRIYRHGFKDQPDADEAFLAGLIHDLGLLVQRQAFPGQLARVIDRCVKEHADFCREETQEFGATHEAFGQALAAKWKFPFRLRAVLGYHHDVQRLSSEHRDLPAVVQLADIVVCQMQIGFPLTAVNQEITPELMEGARINPELLEQFRADLPQDVADAEATLAG